MKGYNNANCCWTSPLWYLSDSWLVAEFPCIVLINVSNSLVIKLVKFIMPALHSKYCATAFHIIAGRGKYFIVKVFQ